MFILVINVWMYKIIYQASYSSQESLFMTNSKLEAYQKYNELVKAKQCRLAKLFKVDRLLASYNVN